MKEQVARWLFKNTDIVRWSLMGYDLEVLDTYEALMSPPDTVFLDEDDLENIEKMKAELFEAADQILALFPQGEGGLLGDYELYQCTLLTEPECWQIEADRKLPDDDLWKDSDLIVVRKASQAQHALDQQHEANALKEQMERVMGVIDYERQFIEALALCAKDNNQHQRAKDYECCLRRIEALKAELEE